MAPWTAEFTVRNEIVTAPDGTKSDLTLTREPGASLVVLRGALPAKSEPRKLVLAIEEPAEHAAALLKRLLEDRGVKVEGIARARHDATIPSPPGDPTVLAEHVSVPLADEIQVINKMSENLHAELLLRTAARQSGLGNSPDDLAKFTEEFYATAGIAPGDVVQSDASGLSRRDLITPRAAVALLRYASHQSWFDVFFSSLPIAGVDGTFADRLKDTPAAERIHAKTGSVEHVRAMSGYADTLAGRRVIFSFLCNNLAAKNQESIATLDAIAVAMVEEVGKPAPAAPAKQKHAH
jgi:D-alanyl-D-alanine carboxypeptidase/D-alanyl-D-alanine-endopeptidase (penicillin-binding protein 4)